MEWFVAVGFLAALAGIAAALLSLRDRRRGPVCPWCGEPGTFRPNEPEVCVVANTSVRRGGWSGPTGSAIGSRCPERWNAAGQA
jgi:hypothetical protein